VSEAVDMLEARQGRLLWSRFGRLAWEEHTVGQSVSESVKVVSLFQYIQVLLPIGSYCMDVRYIPHIVVVVEPEASLALLGI
jgi:hypothetical protein